MTQVLVLNADGWEPLARTKLGRAIALVESGKAVLHEVREDSMLRWAGGEMLWPTVIRLVRYIRIKIHRGPAGWSRRGVLTRDGFHCAFCGEHGDTVDHILPISRGGGSTWLNTVAACRPCNGDKGARTPEEAGLSLLIAPWAPSKAQLVALGGPTYSRS